MVKLSEIICRIESSNNLKTLRFEPMVYQHFDQNINRNLPLIERVKMINRCDSYSALILLSTSWGLYQFMGETLYSMLDLKEDIFDFWNNPAIQYKMFIKFLDIGHFVQYENDPKALIDSQNGLYNFSKFYNGPDNFVAYASKIKETFQEMEG